MWQKKNSIPQWLRLPRICALCQHYHQGPRLVCTFCTQLFSGIGSACQICRLPLFSADFVFCGYCVKNKPFFDQVFTSYVFEEPLRTLLHQFKYQAALYLSPFLTNLMLDALPEGYRPDCLIPVPQHPTRMKQRGFNQALELSKCLAQFLGCQTNAGLCKKISNTAPQTGAGNQARRENLQQAFSAKANSYQHVTIVDDLLTTGSTANQLAYVLKQQGVKQVDVCCVARTRAGAGG